MLKDLFLPGTDYLAAINSNIRRQISARADMEDLLKRPFTGIDSDYSLFCLTEGSYGMASLEILFNPGNPWFTEYTTFYIPLDELGDIISLDMIGAGAAALVSTDAVEEALANPSQFDGVATHDYTDTSLLANTHLVWMETRETKEGNILRQELRVSEMNDGSVQEAINGTLSDFYAEYDNAAILEKLLPELSLDWAGAAANVWVASRAQEFGGFLQFTCEIAVYPEGEDYYFRSRNFYMLFDLATGKRLALSDILTENFYQTDFYKAKQDILSEEQFLLNKNGYINFFSKIDNSMLYDKPLWDTNYFDWNAWAEIAAAPLE